MNQHPAHSHHQFRRQLKVFSTPSPGALTVANPTQLNRNRRLLQRTCCLIFGGARNSVSRPRPWNKTLLRNLLATSARRVGSSIVPSNGSCI
jgi:hypothetical protein